MRRIEILRDEYLPAFQRLAKTHDRPIRAACEIGYCKMQRPGSSEEWPVKSHHLLQTSPPIEGSIYWNADDAPNELFNKWHQLATESAKLFGDWVVQLGLDSRTVRPRWLGCWFLLFVKFSNSEPHPFPMSITRKLKTSDSIITRRDSRPLVLQPTDDIPGRAGFCFASSELISVGDLLRATTLAIHCIVEAAEVHKPTDVSVEPTQIRNRTIATLPEKSKDRLRREKSFLDLLSEYEKWKTKQTKRSGPKDWLVDRAKWSSKSKAFFRKRCSERDGTEVEILIDAIKYAQKLARVQ